MKTILQKVSYRWDVFRGRYQVFEVEKESDRLACIKVLEEVRLKELNRVSGNSVLDSSAFNGQNVEYLLAACRDTKTDKIIGCIKISSAAQARKIPSSVQEYHLNLFPENLVNELNIFTRLAVLKEYRKTPAGLLTMVYGFKMILEKGSQAVLMSCEPNLFTMYKRLGLRPLGIPHNSPSGGYRIPMIFVPEYNYLKKIKSPALIWNKELELGKERSICTWYKEFEQKHGKLHLGASQYKDEDENARIDHVITKGLSKMGRKNFLKNAMVVKCKVNDVIVAENDGGKAMGIVKKGMVKVLINGRPIALLGKGDVFGEIALVLNSKRTATLVAADPKTEVLLFSVSAIKRQEIELDRSIVWQNIAQILAGRLVERTSL